MEKSGMIVPVVLAGGTGSRLWPMSREHFPKQLLPLVSDNTMLHETLSRFADASRFAPPIVLTNESLRFIVAEQMRASGCDGRLVLEPVPRNTAPAITAAAMLAHQDDPKSLLLVVPSDHVIRDVAGFLDAAAAAAGAARDGYLVTFSIVPTRVETGYGYIRRGRPLDNYANVHEVVAFVEKPDSARAEEYVKSGEYGWNSGMFLFPAAAFLEEIERWTPDVVGAVRTAVDERTTDHDFIRLQPEAFAAAPSISVDYAVMEKTDRAAAVPCDAGWTDVGSWNELWNISPKSEDGNCLLGDAVSFGARNCYVRSDERLTCVVGVENLVVVVTDDAVLVADHAHAQDVKGLTEALKEIGRQELTTHSRVYRPWGFYQSLHNGDRFQVKRLTINPGAQLSLQKHFHRAEHWVVVNGTALVTVGDKDMLLRENESTYIPLGAVHRLENPGKLPLNVIEVQSGSYLEEDDIVRFEDNYGRI